ncbi:fimbrial protein [Salmonella enterica]|nr:fimbrial protein [Salmonella enterica]EJW2034404.1 fimbrial protein [Salmonella enterica]EJW2038859.1 fimbrial protein [Salmonella enterica]EJW2070272.1 fimbrial protein [Salmonella enterica]EJW2079411.1 fimbrial protein [Salmonella enterica]
MKITMRHSRPGAFLLLMLALLFAGAAQAKNYTYVVGNDVSGNDGPTGIGEVNYSHGMGYAVAYHQETTLRRLVMYDWSLDTSQYSSAIYCNSTDQTYAPLTLKHGYGTPAGKTPDGHNMWKTNVEGLYFAIEIYSLYTASSTLSTPLPIWFDSDVININFTPNGGLKTACDKTIINTYSKAGGIGMYMHVYLYADNKFKPSRSAPITNVSFAKVAPYDMQFYNATTLLKNSYYMNINITTTSFNGVWPTCTANTVTGTNVKNNTLDFGSYYPKQIIEGLDAVPFQINLTNCDYIRNIEVKLTSGSVGADPTLLSNTLTGNTAASGIGVQIQGTQNYLSNQMRLIPGDTTSVYKYSPYANQSDYKDSADTYNNNTLNFLATLKRDNNQTITPGSFKATGTFQMSYP